MYTDSIYDTPAIDMLDYGDNTGCWRLASEGHLDYEYEKLAYVYTDDNYSLY